MITLKGITRSYPTGSTTVYALRNVSIHFEPGEFGRLTERVRHEIHRVPEA